MKKLLCILAFLLAIAGGIFLTYYFISQNEDKRDNNSSSVEPSPQPSSDPIMDQLDSMSLDEKVAQMLIVGKTSPSITDEDKARLANSPFGGYILMGGAYSTLSGTREMVETLESTSKTPLIITTDQEGGLVQRLRSITYPKSTYIPDMYSVGETGDVTYAKTIGRVLAEELRTIGVNVDLAPDADVFSNPYNTVIGRRSFSADPQLVAKMSQSLAEGLEQNGVTACFKHFPGHGNTEVDSHKSLPIINRTRAELEASELIPFENAIKNGAQFIMVGHIAMPDITGDKTPASLSQKLTSGLLRDELGYKNLIITDGLDMGALVNNYPEEEIYKKAVEAGADLLLLPINPTLAIDTIKANIPESRIDESVYRILSFKQNKLKDYSYLDVSYFGSTEHANAVGR